MKAYLFWEKGENLLRERKRYNLEAGRGVFLKGIKKKLGLQYSFETGFDKFKFGLYIEMCNLTPLEWNLLVCIC